MSLKKTIQEKAFSIEESSGNRYSYKNTEVVSLNDVLGLLDEATKQVLLFQKEAFKEFTKNPNAHDRYYAGKIDAYTEVLAVWEGERE